MSPCSFVPLPTLVITVLIACQVPLPLRAFINPAPASLHNTHTHAHTRTCSRLGHPKGTLLMVGPSRGDLEALSLLNPLELFYRLSMATFNAGRAARRAINDIETAIEASRRDLVEESMPVLAEGELPPEGARTILLVGATGRLGLKVAQALTRSGDKLRLLVREGSLVKLGDLASNPSVSYVVGDLSDRLSVQRACKGVDKVVWMAKADDPRKNMQVECRGLQNVLNALTFSRLTPSPRDGARSELLLDFNGPVGAQYKIIAATKGKSVWVCDAKGVWRMKGIIPGLANRRIQIFGKWYEIELLAGEPVIDPPLPRLEGPEININATFADRLAVSLIGDGNRYRIFIDVDAQSLAQLIYDKENYYYQNPKKFLGQPELAFALAHSEPEEHEMQPDGTFRFSAEFQTRPGLQVVRIPFNKFNLKDGYLLFNATAIKRIGFEPVRCNKDTRFCVTLDKIYAERGPVSAEFMYLSSAATGISEKSYSWFADLQRKAPATDLVFWKTFGEQIIIESGLEYCIVRLHRFMRFDRTDSDVVAIDEAPDAVASINRDQVAKVLPRLLNTPRAVNKRFCLGADMNDESLQGSPIPLLEQLEKIQPEHPFVDEEDLPDDVAYGEDVEEEEFET